MKILSKLTAIAFGMSAAFISSGALADSRSDANINVTGFQLIDLDSTDGITPGITFSNTRNSSTSTVGHNLYILENRTHQESDAFAPNSTSATLDDIGASAHASGGLIGSLYASGHVTNQGGYVAQEALSTSFTLTPKTLLVLSGNVSQNITSDSANPTNIHYLNNYVSVYFSGQLAASASGTQFSGFSNNRSEFGSRSDNHYNQSFTISFLNYNSDALNGIFNAHADAAGNSVGQPSPIPTPSPVPEPETYATMLSGLALMGAVARRRTRNAQA